MRILGLSLLCACGTVTTYQSADTLAPGQWQGMAAASIGAFADRPQATKIPTGSLELGARRGLVEDLDVGGKLYTFGGEASVRWRIARGTWSWALLGAIGGVRTQANALVQEAVLAQLRAGAVATRRTSPRFAWNLGPAVTGSYWWPAGGGSAGGAMVGVFGGFDWQLGERWHLVPELSLHRTIAGSVPVDGWVSMLGAAFARDF